MRWPSLSPPTADVKGRNARRASPARDETRQIVRQPLDVFAPLLLEALDCDDLRDQHVIGLTDRLSGHVRRPRKTPIRHRVQRPADDVPIPRHQTLKVLGQLRRTQLKPHDKRRGRTHPQRVLHERTWVACRALASLLRTPRRPRGYGAAPPSRRLPSPATAPPIARKKCRNASDGGHRWSGPIGRNARPPASRTGHDPVPASPATGVDTITGKGLAEVVVGADVVVDVPNAPVWDDDATEDQRLTRRRGAPPRQRAPAMRPARSA